MLPSQAHVRRVSVRRQSASAKSGVGGWRVVDGAGSERVGEENDAVAGARRDALGLVGRQPEPARAVQHAQRHAAPLRRHRRQLTEGDAGRGRVGRRKKGGGGGEDELAAVRVEQVPEHGLQLHAPHHLPLEYQLSLLAAARYAPAIQAPTIQRHPLYRRRPPPAIQLHAPHHLPLAPILVRL
jgi:hypothetical protein